MRPARRRVAAVLASSVLIGALAVTSLPILKGVIPHGVKVVSREVAVTIDHQRLVRLPIAASHVVLRWTGAPGAVVTVALGRSPDQLSEEIPAGADDEDEAAGDAVGETHGEVIWADGARWARVTTDRPIERLSIVALDTDVSRGVDQSGIVAAAVNQPAIITRAGWGADESYSVNAGGFMRFPPSFDPVQKLIVHHTAGRNNDPDPAATIRAIHYDHAVLRGYGDIDYNFLIDAQGKVYEGRRMWIDTPTTNPIGEDLAGNVVRGAHARHYNDATVGIVLLGNFTSVMPTSAARTSLVNLLAWKAERHGMDPKGASNYVNPVDGTTKYLYNISGHRNVSNTACPGELFYNTFAQLRQDVANKIAATTGSGVDHTPPSVNSLASMGTNPSGAHTQTFGLVFKEPITGLAAGDFTVGGTSDGWTIQGVAGQASTYTVRLIADESGPGPDDGTVVLTLAADSVTDKAGHAGPIDAKSTTVHFATESEPPTAVLYTEANRNQPPGTSYSLTIEFDEPVTGFGPADVVLGGTSHAATPWIKDLIYGQGTNYELTIHRDDPADGTLTFRIANGGVVDLAGNPGDGSNVITRNIDHSAPTTTAPTVSLRSGTTLNAGMSRVKLTWSGSDVGPAGISSYDVARSYDGHAFQTIGTGVVAPTFSWSLSPGHTYSFRVRARDKAGNVGVWKAGPTIKPALTQQSSSAVHYTGSTTTTTYSKYSGGSQRYLGAAGASASYTTTARSLSFVTTKGSSRGSARIYVDGVLEATVDLHAAATTYQFVAFSKTWSTAATHSIKVVSVGTPVPRVDIDAFGVIR